jgi:hypothetical protein
MEGIRYIINDKGEKKAAVINLDSYGNLWGDIHDLLIVESRKSEPRKKWEDVKKGLHEKEP